MRWVIEIGAEFKGAVGSVALKSVVNIKCFFLVDVYPQTFSFFSKSEMIYFSASVIGAAVNMGIQVFAFTRYVCRAARIDPELQVRIGRVAIEISIKRILKINHQRIAITAINDQVKFYRKIFGQAGY